MKIPEHSTSVVVAAFQAKEVVKDKLALGMAIVKGKGFVQARAFVEEMKLLEVTLLLLGGAAFGKVLARGTMGMVLARGISG